MDERNRETITKYLGDMHALESHGLQAISRQQAQLKDEGHPEAREAVLEFKHTLEHHTAALTARLQALGGSPTHPVKEATSAVAGIAAGLYNAVRTEEASKSIRDDYTFFSHCAIAYLMLHATAAGMGDEETVSLAEHGYRDHAAMIMEIDRLMPALVVAELEQDSLPVRDVSQASRQMVEDAWNRREYAAVSGQKGVTNRG